MEAKVLTNGNVTNGNGIYRTLFLIVATALITFVSTWLLVAKDTVRKDDFDKLSSQVQSLQIETARISERLGLKRIGD